MATSQSARRSLNAPLVVLGAAMALLGFVAVLLLGHGSPGAATATGSATVVVLGRDIPARAVIQKGDLTTASLAAAPPGAVAGAGDAVGKVALIDLKQGQPVLGNMLAKSGELGATSTAYLPLPKGFVAMTIPTTEEQGVAGYIQAGDYIDILAVVQKAGSSGAVRTVYSSVHVIRVGPAPPDDPSGAAAAPRHGGITTSLTIVVSQCQSEYLTWFVSNAALRYTLLSYEDYQPAPSAPDTTCPAAGSARGVTDADVKARWPGLL